MRTIAILPLGELDLLEIWHYIAARNFAAANRVTAEIERTIIGLGEMPGKGHRRADIDDTHVRCWSVYSYVIIYRFDNSSLTVLRIVHGARDFGKLFP
jgi:toxin ParE1/3/4